MSGNRVGVSARGRALAVGLAVLLAAGTALAGAGASLAHAAEQVYTHPDGATVAYNDEVAVGEKIVVSGTGWLAKPDRVEEGEEGSVIGFKLIGAQGQLERTFYLENPRLGDEVANKTVWGTVWAESDGSFEVELPWPDASTASTDPQWTAGDSFTLQLLSGTMYSDEAGVDPNQRPDVSRTIPLTITVAGEGEPEPVPSAPVISLQPAATAAASGSQVSFTAAAEGVPAPTVQWQRSTALNASTAPPVYTNIAGATDPTLTVTAGTSPHVNNRWYRAVFTNSEGSVTTVAVKLSIAPVPTVVTHPLGQTVETGGTATFTAAGSSTIDMTLQWQSTRAALANGEPNDATWADVPGATEGTLAVEGTDADAQDGTFYRLVFSNASGSVPTRAAQLRFFSKLDTVTPVTVTGTTYGPSGTEPKEFSVRAPNSVVKGQDIVIEGFNYLAVDGQAGSVANALVDAEYSGDPRTLNTTRTVYHPQTGATYADKRGHNVVQAGGSDGNQGGQTIVAQDGSAQLVHYPEWDPGYFRVIIPWPDETNTTRDAAFFAEHWAAGSQHTVRFLTGSLFTPNGGDYQGGISVRFTIVDEATTVPGVAPAVIAQPAHVTVEAGGDAPFSAAASGDPEPAVQWEASSDGGTTWTPVDGATATTLTVAGAAQSQSGLQYRAVFSNTAGAATTNPAVLAVTPVQDPAYTYTVVLSSGVPAGVLITPKQVEVGKPITVSGSGFFLRDRSGGSGGPIFLNQPNGGTGPVNVVGRTIENQIPGSQYTDARAHGVFRSDAEGNWTLTFPFPTPENSTLTAETAWAAGQTQNLRILTGSLVVNDYTRTAIASVELVAAPDAVPPRVSASVSGRTVTVVATDEGSGVEGIETRIDSGDWQAYQAPFEVPGAAGHRVEFRAFDVAGNTSAVGSITIAATEPSGAITATALGSERTVLVGQPVQGFGVQLADETGAAVRGVPVAFAVTGGSFPAGAGTATVASNAAGIAVAPVVTGEAAGDIVITASWQGGSQVLPTVHVTAPAVSLTATAAAESVVNAGRVEIKVSATNTSAEPVTLVLKTRYGSKTFANVPVGGEVTNNFRTFLSRVPAGTATVTVSTATGTAVFEAPYEAK